MRISAHVNYGVYGEGCSGSDLNNSALLLDCTMRKDMNSNANGLLLSIMDGNDTEWRVLRKTRSMTRCERSVRDGEEWQQKGFVPFPPSPAAAALKYSSVPLMMSRAPCCRFLSLLYASCHLCTLIFFLTVCDLQAVFT